MVEQKATNVTWHNSVLTRQDRERLLNQKGYVIWFTGVPASGKSTLANTVAVLLHKRKHHTCVLDGDNLRCGLNKNLGFSAEDRKENVRRVSEVAKLFADAGTIAIVALASPYRTDRDKARKLIGEKRFVEIFVECPYHICEERDPKGLYKKAHAGEIKEFTNVSAPYEVPLKPEIIVNTADLSVIESGQKIITFLEQAGLIPSEK